MCELLGVSVEEPIRLRFGWDSFARRGSREGGNPDGWGVAYFARRDVLLLREPEPAAESPMVRFLARYAPPSRLIVSHVRRGTQGGRTLENTQPFVRHLAGRAHVFAHNGSVAEPGPIPAGLFLHPTGATDSERLFAVLLSKLEPLWRGDVVPSIDDRLAVVDEFAQSMRERGSLNFLYCDGETLFGHGHRHTLPGEAVSTDPGLYVLERDGRRDDGPDVPCVGLECDGAAGPNAFVATMPLDGQAWSALRPG
jgi:glutamine amidotransferase